MKTSNPELLKQPRLLLSQGKFPVPVLLYLLAVIIPVKFHLGPLSLDGVRLLLMVLIVPLTIRLLMGQYGRILVTDILFFLYIVWTAVAMTVTSPQHVIESVGSTSIEFLGAYMLGRAYIRNLDTFVTLVRFLVIVIVASLPLAFYESITGHRFLIEAIRSIPGLTSFYTIPPDPRFGLERAQVFLPHPIHYGLFASLGFSLCFVGLKGIVATPVRYLLTGLIVLSVFLSLSSGAILPVLLQSGLIFWASMLKSSRHKWMILLALVAGLYVLVDLMSNRAPVEVFMSYATFSPHNAYWRAAIFESGMQNVWSNPVFGLGFNDWVRPAWMHSASVDNFWLLTAMRYGFPGFFLLTTGYLIAMWQIVRRDFGQDIWLRQARLAWMFTFVGVSFALSTVHIWSTTYSFIFFLFGAGFWLVTIKETDPATAAIPMPDHNPKLQYRRTDITPGFTRSPGAGATVASGRQHQAPRSASSTSEDDTIEYSRFSR